MNWEAILTASVVCVVFATLLFKRGIPTDLVFMGGLTVITLCQVITPHDALEGFVNPAVITIGTLYVVSAGLKATGVLDQIGYRLLGTARTERAAMFRLAAPVVALSALINNTPIVAMTVPTVIDWCRRVGVSPSRLLMPISYLAILGGACTLIGTSTNLIVNGMLIEERKDQVEEELAKEQHLQSMGFFEIGYVGLPCALVGIAYLALVGRHLLPNRKDIAAKWGDERRDYLVEMLVQEDCLLIDQTVEEAGLQKMQGLFLVEISRRGKVMTAVSPRTEIREGDRLVFSGVVSTIVDLEKIPGLVPATDASFEADPEERAKRHLMEVVLSDSSPIVRRTIKEARIGSLYGAAVVAVNRNGKRVGNDIDSIRLAPGDTLLLQTREDFLEKYQYDRDFYLVSSVRGSEPRRHDKGWIAILLLALLVALLTVGTWATQQNFLQHGMTAIFAVSIAGAMVVTGCMRASAARGALQLEVLLTIGAALGLGKALLNSGATDTLAAGVQAVADLLGGNAYVLLALIYIMTLVLTEVITNTAVAALMFPLALSVAILGGYDARPFVMAIALAASTSFITPFGYQTNLMVMGPGGYRPIDYLKVGLPLSLLVMTTALLLIPLVWPF